MSELHAANIKGLRWIEDGRLVGYESERGYVVMRGSKCLSFSGVRPSVWGRKSTAVEIADTLMRIDELTWIETGRAS